MRYRSSLRAVCRTGASSGRQRIGRAAALFGGLMAAIASPICQPSLRADVGTGSKTTAPAAALPALHALCVGAGTFADSALRPIARANEDARAVAAALLSQRGRGVYGDVDVHVVVGKEATGARFQRELDYIGSHAQPGDVVVLYLCGYQVADEDARTRFLTVDTDVAEMEKTAPVLSGVHQMLLGLPAGHALVLLDFNHGDPVAAPAVHKDAAARGIQRMKKRAYDPGITTTDLQPTIRMLFSATGQEVALDAVPGRTPALGAFAASLSDALSGRASGVGASMLTAADLCRLVQANVESLSGGKQHPYVPYLSRAFDDFPLAGRPQAESAQRPAPR